MSDLVVIAFPTEAKAEEVRQKLLAMQKEYLLELGDAVVAVKDEKGNIKLNQMINTTAAGAVGGAFWGTLIGLIFLMPLAGAALGAASGAVSGALTDLGISNKFMKETAAAIQPGTAALFVLVRKVTAHKVLEGLKGEGGTVLKTSLDHTKEAVGCACSTFLIELFLSGAAEWAYRRLEGIRVRTQFCAWTLGLTIPNTLIGRADELIE